MGEIKEWITYYWIKWNTVQFNQAGTIPIYIFIYGKTYSPNINSDISFTLQLYAKLELEK